jgi:hypothetical protein
MTNVAARIAVLKNFMIPGYFFKKISGFLFFPAWETTQRHPHQLIGVVAVIAPNVVKILFLLLVYDFNEDRNIFLPLNDTTNYIPYLVIITRPLLPTNKLIHPFFVRFGMNTFPPILVVTDN